MSIESLTAFLGWCSVINIGVFFLWFLGLMFARGLIYKAHNFFFKVPVEKFDSIHYCGLGLFKLFLNFLNVVPYIALKIMQM